MTANRSPQVPLHTVDNNGSSEHFTPAEMMQQAEKYALSKSSKPAAMTLGLAVMAGVFIGLAFVFYITVTTGDDSMSWGLSRLAGGIAFSMGLILVVICGGELFTSSVLSCIARANRQITTGQMLKGWGKVYIGNFIGALVLLALVTAAGLYQLDNGQWGLNALKIAQHKLHHAPMQAFALGILCNLLVCLAIWMTFSSTQIMTKALIVILPVAMFVSAGFEHCVANMFMVPLGIAIHTFAPADFWQQIGVPASQFSDLTLNNFFVANLVPVTLGNIVGGSVLVGLSYWRIYQWSPEKAQSNTQLTPIITTTNNYFLESQMLDKTMKINQIMETNPITVTPETSIQVALDQLLAMNLSGAPVVGHQQQVVGFFSVQDVLVDLWCTDYMPEAHTQVQHLMRREVHTISGHDNLLQLAEYLSIDKDQVYPTSDAGIATSMSTLSLTDRARESHANRPHMIPVVDGETLIGVVTRQHVIKALRPIYGEHLNVIEDIDHVERDIA
ncbi:formate transporter FocA [Echinimonas agarilytica]|uniref:Formate transporter FocA n=1 Tax=Echinimonas agarilytica TaxID=1215918 RepID=A0AA41W580_9GAMM|nr:formate transporter FocA [Echinimonas agarilytica]MCM2678752.1 formate transporter FocA [Echinimonas agarilytica]